jgi:glutaredoxin
MSKKVIFNSKSSCPWCVKGKAYLEDKSIPYEEVIHDDDYKRGLFFDSLRLKDNQRTMPQIIYIEDGIEYRIGGFSDLEMSGIESLFNNPETSVRFSTAAE